jgi:predicted nucleic acid-binding protein
MPGAAESASATTFVDTNVWVYAHLKTPDDPRHVRALALVRQVRGLVISPQVVAEYYSVMLRNGQRVQPANAELVAIALELRNRLGFSFWDCQIVAAALLAGCTTLFTEDLQHGQWIDGRLRIFDPLRELPGSD